MSKIKLIKGDCLNIMKGLKEKSVDLILCDLPYGTTNCKWDSIIPFDELWINYYRVLKDDGAIVLFSAQPFTTALIASNIKKFKYSWYWIKEAPTGFTFSKYQPMRDVEDICVFFNKKTPKYYPQGLKKLEKNKVRKRKITNNESIYKADTLANKEYVTKYTNYPKNTLYFKKDRQGLHPTQKPIKLLEYLIKTYSNENDTILDNTMGSGTAGLAAKNLNRNFIGIEQDDKYFNIAFNRINGYIYEGR